MRVDHLDENNTTRYKQQQKPIKSGLFVEVNLRIGSQVEKWTSSTLLIVGLHMMSICDLNTCFLPGVPAVRRRFCPGCISLRCQSSTWETGSRRCSTTGAACRATTSSLRCPSPPRVRAPSACHRKELHFVVCWSVMVLHALSKWIGLVFSCTVNGFSKKPTVGCVVVLTCRSVFTAVSLLPSQGGACLSS